MEKIKGLLIKPYELPIEIEIDNTLETKQKLVGGNIECVYPTYDDVVFICNDEGKINGMGQNREIGYDVIYGPFLVVGNDSVNCDFKFLTNRQLLDYKIRFDKNSIKRMENKVLGIIFNIKNKGMER